MRRILMLLTLVGLTTSMAMAQGGPRNGTPEERARRQTDQLIERLQLTAPQQDTIYKINLKLAKEAPPALPEEATREERMEQFQKQMTKRTEQIKAVLTPAQRTEYDKLMEEMRERMNNR